MADEEPQKELVARISLSLSPSQLKFIDEQCARFGRAGKPMPRSQYIQQLIDELERAPQRDALTRIANDAKPRKRK